MLAAEINQTCIPFNMGLLGADFEIDQGFYRFKKIYPGENWDPQVRSPLTRARR